MLDDMMINRWVTNLTLLTINIHIKNDQVPYMDYEYLHSVEGVLKYGPSSVLIMECLIMSLYIAFNEKNTFCIVVLKALVSC